MILFINQPVKTLPVHWGKHGSETQGSLDLLLPPSWTTSIHLFIAWVFQIIVLRGRIEQRGVYDVGLLSQRLSGCLALWLQVHFTPTNGEKLTTESWYRQVLRRTGYPSLYCNSPQRILILTGRRWAAESWREFQSQHGVCAPSRGTCWWLKQALSCCKATSWPLHGLSLLCNSYMVRRWVCCLPRLHIGLGHGWASHFHFMICSYQPQMLALRQCRRQDLIEFGMKMIFWRLS